jgi:uncharacterized membrane protein YdjX (TVP38/TMEM64 family)
MVDPDANPNPSPARRRLPIVLLVVLVMLFLTGHAVRTYLGLELSVDSLQDRVQRMGWKGPAVFVGLVTFRQFLALPSWIILPSGGLAFGGALGTVLGTLGIVLSGGLKFGLARGVGREWVRPHLGARYHRLEAQIESAGAWVVAAVTGHPAGPMAAFHWAAGLSSIAFGPFLIALAGAGFVRAALCSYFGAALARPGTAEFWLMTAVFSGAMLLPFASRRMRRRVFGG